ncbi:MAG: TetR/AcrR family transcriptional regulator, partial [Candidatus Hodarchaeota archaeon]
MVEPGLNKRKTSPKLTRRQRKVQRNREIILNAALDLFREKTYDEVKMDEIADRSALSKATLYNYYENKESLYFAVAIWKSKEGRKPFQDAIASKASGLELVIKSCEVIWKAFRSDSFPYIDTTHRFFSKLNQTETIPWEDIENQLTENQESEETTNSIFLKSLKEALDREKQWIETIQKGLDDGSIKSKLAPEQLAQVIPLIYTGIFTIRGNDHIKGAVLIRYGR